MKNTILFLFSLLLFASCKPTASIITTKEVAVKKGVYQKPVAKKTTPKKESSEKKAIAKNIESSSNDADMGEFEYNSIPLKNHFVLDAKPVFSADVDQLIFNATENIGVHYRSGGTTPAGFDCSGLMYNIFSKNNISLPRTSYEQSKLGKVIDVDREAVKKGDLIFFKTRGGHQINHVGMVVEISENEIKFIHSSTSKGVMISSTKESYYKNTFSQINRILESE